MAADHHVAGAAEFLAGMASAIVSAQQPDLPFYYRFWHLRTPGAMYGEEVDDPGLLTGSAGIALALWTYHMGVDEATPWDAALMLS